MGKLFKCAIRLEIFTVSYNILETALPIAFGLISASIALVGFGLDGVVESLSGVILLWRFASYKKGNKEEEEKRVKKTEKFVAVTFVILAAFIGYESIEKLIIFEIPLSSLLCIIIAVLSLIIMLLLTYYKYKTGKDVGNKAMIADSNKTRVCALLLLSLFLELGSNYLFNLEGEPNNRFGYSSLSPLCGQKAS